MLTMVAIGTITLTEPSLSLLIKSHRREALELLDFIANKQVSCVVDPRVSNMQLCESIDTEAWN